MLSLAILLHHKELREEPLSSREHGQTMHASFANVGRLKSGRGRGGEAVIMVENVRTYYDILSRFERDYKADIYPAPILLIPPM